MVLLILLVLFGVLAAGFATQNTMGADIMFGGYQLTAIPMYLVVLGSMLLGILLAWFISLVTATGHLFTVFRKDRAIADATKTVDDLQKRVADLEDENAKLREKYSHMPIGERVKENISAVTR